MKKNHTKKNIAFALLLSLSGGFALTGAALPAAAQTITAPDASKQVSPEVAGPLQEAQKAWQEKNYPEALAKLNSITKTPLTPYESYLLDRTRLGIASATGDDKSQAELFPKVIDSSEAPKDEHLGLMLNAAIFFEKHNDVKQALAFVQRYVQEGGPDPRAHDLLVSYYYLTDDYVHAGQELRSNLDVLEKAGKTPSELQLQLLTNIAFKQKDNKGLTVALEKVVVYYPSKVNWTHVVQNVHQGLPQRLDLDYNRLKNQVGLLEAKDYAYYADDALHAGYAAEAKKVLDAGYAAKVIDDATPDIKPQMAQATKEAATEARTIGQTEAEVRKTKEGLGLVNVGYAYVTLGQFDKGLPMMEEGMKVNGLKRADESRLHLGVAYAMAGQKEKAIEAFKSVQGSDGTADLARVWILVLNYPMH